MPELEAKRRVLIVDDDSLIRSSVQAILTRRNFVVAGAKSAAEARALLLPDSGLPSRYDLILLDIKLGPESGIDLLKELRAHGVRSPVMMVSGAAEADKVRMAAGFSVLGFIVKPFTAAVLSERVEACLEAKAAA